MEEMKRETEEIERAEAERVAQRDALTEALVGLIRTGGTASFPRISDKDRVFFRGLMVSGDPMASEALLRDTAKEVRAMRRRLTVPKCTGCSGAPDLTGEFSLRALEKEEREVRALKFLILAGLRDLAGTVYRAMERGVHDPALNEAFYRTMFVIGEDFAEEDLLQIAYSLADMQKNVSCGKWK